MQFSAVIFDLDGTILENGLEYEEAFGEVLKSLGVRVSGEIGLSGGIGVKKEWENLIQKYQIKTDKTSDELTALTQAAYLKKLSGVTLKDGFVDFVEGIKEAGMLVGLATSNDWGVLEKVFEMFDIQKYFDAIVTIEEVLAPKPAPDLFLRTAEKLDVPDSECVVIEDSDAGIAAAKEAGMQSIKITDTGFSELHPSEIRSS